MRLNLFFGCVALVLAMLSVPRGWTQTVSGAALPVLPDLGEASSATLSPQMERRIGEEAMRQIRAREPAYLDDPEVGDYLNSLGRKLAAASTASGQDFEFFVIKDNSINAFAMPGGFIGVHTGLLLAAQTESELASVLAHEVSHVTQRHIARLMGNQSQLSPIMLAGMLIGAFLASRSGSTGDLGQAAVIAAQGGGIQAQLGYTRDFEREADRIGFQVLQQAGFDVTGMVSFFERLQKNTRAYENNAPAYLRSHPLTLERIADIQNRLNDVPYRQRPDSIDFHLVKAKLRSEQGIPREALAYFRAQLESKRFASEAGARFGLVSALVRANDFPRAEEELRRLRKLVPQHPMLDLLATRLKTASGDLQGATELAKTAVSRWHNLRSLRYAYVQLLQRLGQHQEALVQLTDLAYSHSKESRVYAMQAQSYAALGHQLLRHRAQAEAYYLQGATPAAIEQLQLAQRAGDGDFYQLSSVEARLRELRANLAMESRRR